MGPADAKSNAVICNPSNGTAAQFDLLGHTPSAFTPHDTAGTRGAQVSQANGFTIMTWTRDVFNGDPLDAQIATWGPTNVIWAIGASNDLAHVLTMNSTMVDLAAPSFDNSVVLVPGLGLSWNIVGSTYTFQAVLNQVSW